MDAYYSGSPFGAPYSAGSPTDRQSVNTSTTATVININPGNPGSYDLGDSPSSRPRKCSVRGCVAVMPTDTSNKMCDACRGRHRIYAMTKRAKRKMEKEALNQQGVALLSTERPPGTVWLPENPAIEDDSAGAWVTRPDISAEVRHISESDDL